MKRNEQIWWIIIGVILLAISSVALTHIAIIDSANSPNSFSAHNSASAFCLFAGYGNNNSPSKDEKPPKNNPQPGIMLKAVFIPTIDHFLTLRQIIPLWEKSFILNKPFRRLGFFIPLLAIMFFSIFYQAARTGSGDEDPYHPVL